MAVDAEILDVVDSYVKAYSLTPVSPTHSAWVDVGPFSMYLRYGRYYVDGVLCHNVLVVANVGVIDGRPGTGLCWSILDGLSSHKDVRRVVVENVVNRRLGSSLVARGWRKCNLHNVTPSYTLLADATPR